MGSGQFRITAESGEATVSQEVDIVIEEDAQLAIIIPTSAPTELPEPSPTPTETPPPTATQQPPLPTVTPASSPTDGDSGRALGLSEVRSLLGVMTGLLTIGVVAMVADRRLRTPTLTQRIGRLLWGITGGLLVYNYYALGMPGSDFFTTFGSVAGLVLVTAGGFAGLLLYRPLSRS